MSKDTSPYRCDKCASIDKFKPSSKRSVALIDFRTGKLTQPLTEIRVLFDNAEELILSAEAGCDICSLLLQSLFHKCSSAEQEEKVKTFKGAVLVSINPEYVDVELERFMFAKVFYAPRGWSATLSEGTSSLAKSALSMASDWLSACAECHSCFPIKEMPPILPTRVIDVGTERLQIVRLTTSEGKRSHYFALSYCWGPPPFPYRLEKAKLSSLLENIDPDTLPNTIRDAIDTTRRLGFRYLWVDALCIIQDDEMDWRREASLMAEVYGNAYCTISATGAADAKTGCFTGYSSKLGPHKSSRILVREGKNGPAVERILLPTLPEWAVAVSKAPINDRMWTLQERALSHRVLHWTRQGLFWECNEQRRSEFSEDEGFNTGSKTLTSYQLNNTDSLWSLYKDDDDGISLRAEAPVSFDVICSGITSPQKIQEYWSLIAMEASRRNVTFEEDILPALAGLAKVIQSHLKDEYLAGMWRTSLPHALFWRAIDTRPKPLPKKRRVMKLAAPSWSWASIRGEMRFPNQKEMVDYTTDPDLEILDAKTSLVGSDQFGQVTGGMLRIRGLLSKPVTAVHFYDASGKYSNTRIEESSRMLDHGRASKPFRGDTRKEILLDVTPPDLGTETDSTTSQTVFCLRACIPTKDISRQATAIALEPVPHKSMIFRRVGWVDSCDTELFVSRTRTTITVI